MPRAKTVTMGSVSPQEAHEAALAKSVKLYSPYEVVDGELVGEEDYAVVYRAPRGGDRKVIATRSVRANATKLRDMLNRAWAEGFWSSGKE